MKSLIAAVAILTAALSFSVGMSMSAAAPQSGASAMLSSPSTPSSRPTTASHPVVRTSRIVHTRRPAAAPNSAASLDALNDVVDAYCIDCHSNDLKLGNLTLEGFDIAHADTAREKSEKMIRKLRAEMMPLAGRPRPPSDTLQMLADAIERVIDKASPPNAGLADVPAPQPPRVRERGSRPARRRGRTRPTICRSTRRARTSTTSPTCSSLSPTLLEAYLNAAATVSRMAVGDRNAPASMTTYRVSPYISQHPWDHVEGAPYGTRGGIVAQHTFLADGQYELRFNVAGGIGTQLEDIDVSIDGERVALLNYERGVNKSFSMQDLPLGVDLYKTEPLKLTAGQHRVSVAFVRRTEGPYEDLIKPHDWSLASSGTASAGTTMPPHIMELGVVGPQNVVGVSETPSRRIIFSLPPVEPPSRDSACAEQIVTRLGTQRLSPAADGARHGRPDGVLQARRAGGRVRGRRPHRRCRRCSRARTSCSGSRRRRRTPRRARTTRSATSSSRRASRSSSGAAFPTIGC